MKLGGHNRLATSLGAVALLCLSSGGLAQQVADPDFSTRVEHPAFTKAHPRAGIDEAHKNFHTREGRYKPFAALLESDGYAVSSVANFEATSLAKLDILIIANALGERRGEVMGPAF